MNKSTGFIATIVGLGGLLLMSCANGIGSPTDRPPLDPSVTPAPTTASSRTPGISAEAKPGAAPLIVAEEDASHEASSLTNPQRISGYNTNLRGRFKTGGRIKTAPTLSDGTLYIGSGDSIGPAGLFALSLETGQEVWRFPTEGGVQSSPAVVDGVVYFGSRDDHFYAADAQSGEEI